MGYALGTDRRRSVDAGANETGLADPTYRTLRSLSRMGFQGPLRCTKAQAHELAEALRDALDRLTALDAIARDVVAYVTAGPKDRAALYDVLEWRVRSSLVIPPAVKPERVLHADIVRDGTGDARAVRRAGQAAWDDPYGGTFTEEEQALLSHFAAGREHPTLRTIATLDTLGIEGATLTHTWRA